MILWLLVAAASGALLRARDRASAHADAREGAGAHTGTSMSMTLKMHTTAKMGMKGASNAGGNMLYGSVKIGTPPQEFLVAIDTCGGNLMIPAKTCQSQACMAHRYYDVALSTSGHKLATLDGLDDGGPSERVTLAYSRGEITGTFVHDTVCVGNMCVGLNFIEADTMTDEPFNLVPFDGVLGLGMPLLSTTKNFNLMGEFADDKALTHQQFAIWLAREGDGEDSELVLGDFKPERLASEIVWVPLSIHPGKTSTGFWQIDVGDMAINNNNIDVCGGKCQAAADSSTTAIGLPGELFNIINTEASVREDCSNLDQLPKVGFVIDGYILNLRPIDYVARSADGSSCATEFYPINVPAPNGPLILLGTPFLTQFYTIYDRETLKLGLALAVHKGVEAEEVHNLFFKVA